MASLSGFAPLLHLPLKVCLQNTVAEAKMWPGWAWGSQKAQVGEHLTLLDP
jgi:hypothetical protein